jgi:hypothetical protein
MTTAKPLVGRQWDGLVSSRRWQIARFLSWAETREATDSLRLAHRVDIARAGHVVDAFSEPWWAATVYTCFDSEIGARAVAPAFRSPVGHDEAERLLSEIDLPIGSVGGHRTQPAHRGAKVALLSACARADEFESILKAGRTFHARFLALRGLQATQWGRTTCYDLLVRAGQLRIGSGARYEPDRAYLAESTGPRKGFELIWGIEVNRRNAAECEALLRWWTERWHWVADEVGVSWAGLPYGPGDFENALCIYQERGNPGYGLQPNE